MATQPSKLQDAVDRITSGTTRFELVYTTDSSWPRSPTTSATGQPLQISVLDSSFNPPTLAHAALAAASAPSTASVPYKGSRLLLLSISNADKTPKPGDATPVQRLEMMIALANELAERGGPRLAVAAVNEPTFVGKSTLLLEQLSHILESSKDKDPAPKIELIFQMGWDTIIRVFAPRYYPSPESMLASFRRFFGPEGSTILCARRPIAPPPGALSDEESEFLSSPYVAPFYKEHKIQLIDLDSGVKGISSSVVRKGTIESAERMCTPGVVRCIREHRLYYWK